MKLTCPRTHIPLRTQFGGGYRFLIKPRKGSKKAPRTRTTPATTTNTTSVTNAQLQAMIDQGVTATLAARDANRNGDDSILRERVSEGLNALLENDGELVRNSHVRNVGHDVAYAMTWTELKNKMTDKYCPRNEMKKLEAELWNLKVKGTDVIGYSQRFQELALLCVRMFPIARHDSRNASCTQWPCTVKCGNCKKVGHMTRDCRNPAAARNQRNLTCYECGNQGHYRSDCPELKNQNLGNQAEGTKARGMVYALGGGETDQDLNNIEDEIEA
ncbi:reverse transcriptase domain-containing protein [Tanacetum coccineum]|uniref:Reverse transcriptase domain-containing protein n=1 Tax=Tanacetum coccineum TaxID=301880 RepID=A0ABQ5DAN1_9ASTR